MFIEGMKSGLWQRGEIKTPSYIQSAFAIPNHKKGTRREFSLSHRGLLKKIIIMKDVPAPWYAEEVILVMRIYDFLLREDSLEGI